MLMGFLRSRPMLLTCIFNLMNSNMKVIGNLLVGVV